MVQKGVLQPDTEGPRRFGWNSRSHEQQDKVKRPKRVRIVGHDQKAKEAGQKGYPNGAQQTPHTRQMWCMRQGRKELLKLTKFGPEASQLVEERGPANFLPMEPTGEQRPSPDDSTSSDVE